MSEAWQDPAYLMGDLLGLFLLGLFTYAVLEFLYLHFVRRAARTGEYGMAARGVVINALIGIVIGLLIGPVSKLLFAIWGAQLAPFQAGLGLVGVLYGLFIYEMCYWLQHWLAHKVRLLWCLHSPHHAPESMHLFVGFNHSFLETIFYMPFTLGFIPAVLGVDPWFIAIITIVDVVWGNMLHMSDKVVERRWGILEKFMQTPSYHRVHHARNPMYKDRNYNSITLLGDWLMGTLVPLDDEEPVDFGITRSVNTSSFLDVHFGEFALLFQDLRRARDPGEFLSYLFRAPDWKPAHT